MNKVVLVGRLVRDPQSQSTQSGIKWARFTIAVNRPFGDEQADFIPVVCWRSQADFVDNYLKKGSLISVEGRFTSSTYNDNSGNPVTRYEVTADRIESLESKAEREARESRTREIPTSATDTQVVKFAEENKPASDDNLNEVPWDLDL